MPGFFMHVGATAICTHGGQVSVISSNLRVRVSGQPVATFTDTYTVAGCPFQIPFGVGTKPQPCVLVKWVTPSVRVRVGGQPVILQSSTGLCQSVEQIPQGPPSVVVTQMRVRGS
jgi:hypothetical protein